VTNIDDPALQALSPESAQAAAFGRDAANVIPTMYADLIRAMTPDQQLAFFGGAHAALFGQATAVLGQDGARMVLDILRALAGDRQDERTH